MSLAFLAQSIEGTSHSLVNTRRKRESNLFHSDDEDDMSTSLPLSFLESNSFTKSNNVKDSDTYLDEDFGDEQDDKPEPSDSSSSDSGGSYESTGGDSQDPDVELEWRKLSNEERVDEMKPKFNPRVLEGDEIVNMDNPVGDSFSKIFSDEILQFIVDRTNIYAIQKLEKGYQKYLKEMTAKGNVNQKKLSMEEWPRRRWRPVDLLEFKSFLATMMLMGIIKKPKIRDYWKIDGLTINPSFGKIISSDRFWIILSFLHFSCTKPFSKGYIYNPEEPLANISEICDRFVRNWKKYYQLEQEIAIDESVCVYKGVLGFKQYCPRKHHRWGIKFFSLACSRTGYIYNTIPYSGKSTSGSSNDIIKVLVKDVEKRGHHIFMDNYFSSFKTLNDLEAMGFGVTATIRLVRKGLPNEVRKMTKKDLKFDESIFYVYDNFLLALWKDTRVVSAISNIYGTDFEDRTKFDRGARRNVKLMRPRLIAEYSRYMHGVDRADQLLSYYDFSRRSHQWWKKVFYYLIQVSICNAYIIYAKSMRACARKPRSSQDYRLDVIEYLLSENKSYQEYRRNLNLKSLGQQKIQAMTSRMHLIERDSEESKRKCAYCKKSRSRYKCCTCSAFLCLQCFKPYHIQFKPIAE